MKILIKFELDLNYLNFDLNLNQIEFGLKKI